MEEQNNKSCPSCADDAPDRAQRFYFNPLNSSPKTIVGNSSTPFQALLPRPFIPAAGGFSDVLPWTWELDGEQPAILQPAPPEVRMDGIQLEIYQFVSKPVARPNWKQQNLDAKGHPLFPGAAVRLGRSRIRFTVGQRLTKGVYRLHFTGADLTRWGMFRTVPNTKPWMSNSFTLDEEEEIVASGRTAADHAFGVLEVALGLVLNDLHLTILEMGVDGRDIEPPRIEIKRFEGHIDYRFETAEGAKDALDCLKRATAQYGPRWIKSKEYDPILGTCDLYEAQKVLDPTRLFTRDNVKNYAKPYLKTPFTLRGEIVEINPATPFLHTPEVVVTELRHQLAVTALHLLAIQKLATFPVVKVMVPEAQIREALVNYRVDIDKFKDKWTEFIRQVCQMRVYDRAIIPTKKLRLGQYHLAILCNPEFGMFAKSKTGRGTGRGNLKLLILRNDFLSRSKRYDNSVGCIGEENLQPNLEK